MLSRKQRKKIMKLLPSSKSSASSAGLLKTNKFDLDSGSGVADESKVSLDRLLFSAKIDYITIHTHGKVKLPTLAGRAIWPKKHHNLRLTVHDATAADIAALIRTFGTARLVELEIAIDVRPAAGVPLDQREAMLRAVMVDIFARGLEPSAGESMAKGFRAFYRRLESGYMVRPYNHGLPRASDQQLHGGRNDAAQVKGYWKRFDNRKALAPEKHCARVEVRLGSEGLVGHNLSTLTDLNDFKFRKKLMPYFRHVQGSTRLVRCKRGQPRDMLTMLRSRVQQHDQEHWSQAGVGPFLKGGKRELGHHRLMRDTPVNNRLGQALMRLEKQFRAKEFVRHDPMPAPGHPSWARPAEGFGQSRMTI